MLVLQGEQATRVTRPTRASTFLRFPLRSTSVTPVTKDHLFQYQIQHMADMADMADWADWADRADMADRAD